MEDIKVEAAVEAQKVETTGTDYLKITSPEMYEQALKDKAYEDLYQFEFVNARLIVSKYAVLVNRLTELYPECEQDLLHFEDIEVVKNKIAEYGK